MKPEILVRFDDTGCEWLSVGWGGDRELMTKARDAIRKGETPAEVVALLEKAGFEVTQPEA